MNHQQRKKLIEVALPLEAINVACAHEKMPGIGAHPRGLHLWWARRPLAAARAVIFAQMVDDPSAYVQELTSPGTESRKAAERELKKRLAAWIDRPGEEESAVKPTLDDVAVDIERQRLFKIIEELVKWENTTNEVVLRKARDEIWRSWRRNCAENVDHPRAKELFDREKLPAFHDPFAGGGALPLEAQRLGLEAYASDLNPVAVLINKAMIEIPPKFAGMPPVNPEWQAKSENEKAMHEWKGAEGLAEDIRYYGKWMRDEAEKRIGHLYPKVEITAEIVAERPDLKPYLGKKLTVIAWIWARTVKSPSPAFRDIDVPLASTFMLSTKPGKETYVEPVIESGGYEFKVRAGEPVDKEGAKNGTKLARGANFKCLMSGAVVGDPFIKQESMAGRMGSKLMAIVAEGKAGRVYLSPSEMQANTALSAVPNWVPDEKMNRETSNLVSGRGYGFFAWADLFTSRQLVALTTFSDLVKEARERVKADAIAACPAEGGGKGIDEGGGTYFAYANSISVYLGFGISRLADYNCAVATWKPSGEQVMQAFKRQALPMTWDFPESNVLGTTAICWKNAVRYSADSVAPLGIASCSFGTSTRTDARTQCLTEGRVVSTDPPYYDNIGYADLSDFFYVWLRRSLRDVYPDLFATMAVPKAEELVATPYRHGGKVAAEKFFLEGMTRAMGRISEQSHPAFPVTIYYAFKQSESTGDKRRIEHWLGDISRCRNPCWICAYRHVANENGTQQSHDRFGNERPRL